MDHSAGNDPEELDPPGHSFSIHAKKVKRAFLVLPRWRMR
jgi:hypothetical protein